MDREKLNLRIKEKQKEEIDTKLRMFRQVDPISPQELKLLNFGKLDFRDEFFMIDRQIEQKKSRLLYGIAKAQKLQIYRIDEGSIEITSRMVRYCSGSADSLHSDGELLLCLNKHYRNELKGRSYFLLIHYKD